MYLLKYSNHTRWEKLNSLVNQRNWLISFSKQSIQSSPRLARRSPRAGSAQMSPYLWHNCGAPSLKSLPGRSRLWLNPARELCERLLFSWTYIEHPSEVTGWLMFPSSGGMIQVEGGCCCPVYSWRWLGGAAFSGLGWRGQAAAAAGQPGRYRTDLKGKMLLWTQNWLWTLLGD